jgi:hypothetical protein
MPVLLILFILTEIVFGVFVILAGRDMSKMTSAKKSLQTYKEGKEKSFAKDYFLFWKYPLGQTVTLMMIKSLGDRYTTVFYKASGIFFLISSPIFFLAPILQLQLLIVL